jgi:formylglycine-generating enzyme required for sulfatase activity
MKFGEINYEFILVDGGSFLMGSNDGYEEEQPIHKVRLSSYYLGKTVVTQKLWKFIMGNNPSIFKGDNHPVENISWQDAQEFLHHINKLSENRFRLPTEAEWEFACRGGNLSKQFRYSGSDKLDEVGWFELNSNETTHAVGEKNPNELGFLDMNGNVSEWCSDLMNMSYYSQSPELDPKGPALGNGRSLRGGGWVTDEFDSRSACRNAFVENGKSSYCGIRLVRCF